MGKQEITDLLNSSRKELLALLDLISQEEINRTPFKGSWTAGELAGHLIKSTSSFTRLIINNVEDTPADFSDRVNLLKEIMLDFDKKFDAPEFIVPDKINYKKDEILATLNSLFDELIKSAGSLDLSKTCTLFDVPGIGKITRKEAAWFVIYHTQRHIHQLKDIILKLEEN